MKEDVERWIKEDGERFLREIGIREGHIVLDFGCNEGHYAIPAAKVVGSKGRVYAVDKDKEPLDKLEETARLQGLENIETVQTTGEPKIALEDESVDVVLLYDVLHYMSKDERKKLFGEIYRVLNPGGFLSVYPKHTSENHPLWELAGITREHVKREIKGANFSFKRKFYKKLIHDESHTEDYILNFTKQPDAKVQP